MNMTDSFFVDEANPPPRPSFSGIQPATSGFCDLHPPKPPPEVKTAAFDAWHCSKSRAPRKSNLMGETGFFKPLGMVPYLEDHPS